MYIDNWHERNICMKTHKIYIMISFTHSVLGKIIKAYTKERYVHVSIITNKDASHGYSFGRKNLHNPFIGGFVIENYDEWFEKFPNAYCRILELEVKEKAYYEILNKISHFEKNAENYSYNILGLFLRFFGKGFSFKNKYFCSQFVSHVLKEAHVMDFDKEDTLVTAKDFRENNRFNIVYEGSLYLRNI